MMAFLIVCSLPKFRLFFDPVNLITNHHSIGQIRVPWDHSLNSSIRGLNRVRHYRLTKKKITDCYWSQILCYVSLFFSLHLLCLIITQNNITIIFKQCPPNIEINETRVSQTTTSFSNNAFRDCTYKVNR